MARSALEASSAGDCAVMRSGEAMQQNKIVIPDSPETIVLWQLFAQELKGGISAPQIGLEGHVHLGFKAFRLPDSTSCCTVKANWLVRPGKPTELRIYSNDKMLAWNSGRLENVTQILNMFFQ